MRFELRMAWREIRPAYKRFLFMIASIAIGVGALTGIKGTASALEHAMSRSARELIAADIAIRLRAEPTAQEARTLDRLVELGAARTQVSEMLSMAAALDRSAPVLATVKAVDPALYPFYGSVDVEPAAPLAQVLDDGAAVASRELLIRTGTNVGDRLAIGAGTFRISAVLLNEPDRLYSGVELGPRVLITRKGLERAALMQYGSRSTESFLFRLPENGLELDTARIILNQGIQRAVRIADYREPNPSVSKGLERMATFLSMVALLAVMVGGLGLASTLDAYLKSKLDSIAILKCLGGRSRQVTRIYLTQGAVIGILGSIAGVGLGYLVQVVFPPLLRGLLQVPTRLELAPGAAIQGFLVGTVTTLLFLLPPLLAIRRVRPGRVFLREMPGTRLGLLDRIRRDPLPLSSALVLIGGTGLLASWLAESWRRGFGFIAGLAGAIAILALGARLLLAALRRIPNPRSVTLRHGLKNLHRPGNHMASVLVSLGLGVGFVLTIYLVQTSLVQQVVKSAPANYPNVFLIGISESQKPALWAFLRAQPGVVDAGIPVPAISGRLLTIDGKTADQLGLEPDDRRYFQTEFVLTWAQAFPADTRLTKGAWWEPPFREPMVSIGASAARWLKVPLGGTVEFSAGGKTVRARVTSVREIEMSRPGNNNQFIFSPGALDGCVASYVGTPRLAPEAVAAFQKTLFERFPTVTSIDVGQVVVRVQELVDKIASVIRFVAFFSIASGVIILASSVVATRYQRIREAVLLKTLGATRSQVARIQAAEFLTVGLVAGIIGSLLAAAAADYILRRLMEVDFTFRWIPIAVATVATAGLAMATGWLASRGVLNHKPLEILREE
jgi:putative ABC transport system permease protein